MALKTAKRWLIVCQMATQRHHISIDRFGRVVLPKGVRERLGVSEGAEFEIEETEDAILLRPVIKPAKVVSKNGWLALKSEGPPLTLEEVNEVTEKIRKQRAETILK